MRVFRNNFVFEDYLINTLADTIFAIAHEMPSQNIMLTGLASYFMQQGVDDRPLVNIVFKTQDINVYNLIAAKISDTNALNLQRYNNRLLFELEGSYQLTYVEIWLDPEPTQTVDVNGVICEKYDNINPILL